MSWQYLFTMWCYASLVCAVVVCLSCAGIVLRQLSVKSWKHHYMVALRLKCGHPKHGCQVQVEWIKISDFWQITWYNSKTVQDRCIVSVKVEQEVICTISNGHVADDLGWPLTPKTTPISTFCIAFRIYSKERRDFKFGIQVDHSKSQPADDKSSL